MRTSTLASFLIVLGCAQPHLCSSQLTIANGSFEEMSNCPDDLAQVYLLAAWHDVVNTADYYNCGLVSSYYPTSQGGYLGEGYVGFASYGDANGSAEALGQNLPAPLAAGSYPLSFAVKRANGGGWSSDCGGVSVFGLADTLPAPLISVYAADLDGAVLLGTSELVDNTEWETRSLTLVVPSEIRSIVFTNAHTPSCSEVIFLDALSTGGIGMGVDDSAAPQAALWPNPAQDIVSIQLENGALPCSWSLVDASGRTLRTGVLRSRLDDMDVTGLTGGVYSLRLSDGEGRQSTQRFVKSGR